MVGELPIKEYLAIKEYFAHLFLDHGGGGDMRANTGAYPVAGVALVAASAALFAINGTASKLVLAAGLSPMQLAEARSVGAALVLCVAAVALDRRSLRLTRGQVAVNALIGVVGIGMTFWLYFVALSRVPVGIALLVEFTAPVLVALWMRFVRRASIRRRVWPAAGLVLTGLALVAQVWAGLTLDGLGLAAAAGDAIALATYFVLGERCLAQRNPVAVSAVSFVGSAGFFSVLLPWWTFPFDRLAGAVAVGEVAVPVGLLVLGVVLLGTVVPFVLELYGLRSIGATRTGLVGTLEPVLAGVVAWGMLDERLAVVQVIGAAVVLAAIVIAESAGPPPTHAPDAATQAAGARNGVPRALTASRS
ncbi:MAG: EamA family transporter [Kineosporiaceae bacterium]